jgi:hypothetical protein
VTITPWTEPSSKDSSFGKLAGSVVHEADIVCPAADENEWEACQ